MHHTSAEVYHDRDIVSFMEWLGSELKLLGVELPRKVWGDAWAALVVISHKSMGKTRRIDAGWLWIRRVATENKLKFGKVLGSNNPADSFINYLNRATIRHNG